MAAEDIDRRYFTEQLQKGIRDIFKAQRLIAQKNIYQKGSDRVQSKREGSKLKSRSGALMNALLSPEFSVNPDGQGVHAEMKYPTYIRFLDMKRLGNWKIYNRQIWGILYKDTSVKMRYGFSDWLNNLLYDSVKESINALNK